ncbi:MAG: hypothetical protein JO257_19945 [Deltaproteobacteria bacterium]|nr:hypothetical protein [Deltaproteobacteria bacterium]
MRIGELLVEQKTLRRSDLDRVLAEKPADRRLVSTLIARGLLDFDDGARALGGQHGVPAALSKHLAGRDPALAKLIPATLGRESCALPLGRTSGGALIVACADPQPALRKALEAAAKVEVLMVVSPIQRLETLITKEYGAAAHDEFDVDFSSAVEVAPPLPDMDALDPDSVRLALTDLDDARVDKDPSQSGQFALPRATTAPPGPMSYDVAKVSIERATTREAAIDTAIAFIGGRWQAGIVLLVRDQQAVGVRGHNVKLPETLTIALTQPSTVAKAIETKKPSIQSAVGPAQAGLKHALANAATPAAAPVLVKGLPAAVLAVGDPFGSDDGLADLGKLADALGRAFERLVPR